MNWRTTVPEFLSDALRLAARAGLLVNAIILSFFSVYFVWRLCWRLKDYPDPWLERGN